MWEGLPGSSAGLSTALESRKTKELEEARDGDATLGRDIHRQQITFDAFDPKTGELERGRIQPATRERLRVWLARFDGRELEAAVEATTGWRFVAEELARVGAKVHPAETAETAARRGPKRRAKTDRLDARHLRELLQAGRLPESWIPPAHILDLRSRVRLRKTLIDQRSAWQRRMHACLFHDGAPKVPELLSGEGRARLARLALPEAAAGRPWLRCG